jgi:hypothetical protein
MTTALRTNHIQDEYERPVPGASIYVYNADGSLAALTSDGTTVIANPLTSDAFGNYSYYALVAFYREDVWFGGKLRWSENNVAVGPISKGDPGGNAMAIGLALAVAGLNLASGASAAYNQFRTEGYTTTADGGEAFYRRMAVIEASEPGMLTSSDGVRLGLAMPEGVTLEMFGAVRNSSTSGSKAANNAALSAALTFKPVIVDTYYGPTRKIKTLDGYYHFSQSYFNVKHCVAIMSNSGWAGVGGYTSTQFYGPLNWKGLIFQAYNTIDETVEGSPTTDASGSLVVGIQFIGNDNTFTNWNNITSGQGIWARTMISVIGCKFTGLYDGWRIEATAGSGGATEGQASGCFGMANSFMQCRHDGLHIDGADANAGRFIHHNYIAIGRFGVYDWSFLGNDHDGGHFRECGGRTDYFNVASQCYYSGSLYYVNETARPNPEAAFASDPATTDAALRVGNPSTNTLWTRLSAGSANLDYPDFTTFAGTFQKGGPIIIRRGGVGGKVYGESGQPPFHGSSEADLDGGTVACGFLGFGTTRVAGQLTTNTLTALGQTRVANSIANRTFEVHNNHALASGLHVTSLLSQGYEVDGTTPLILAGTYAWSSSADPATAYTTWTFFTRAVAGAGAQTDWLTLNGQPSTPDFSPATDNVLSLGIAAQRFKSIFGYTGDFKTSVLCSGSGGVGYSTGAGAAVTQLTNKSTATPAINKTCGQVTMNNAALAGGAKVSFVVTNSTVAATDTVIVSVASGGTANAYRAAVTAISAGASFTVTVENITGGSLSEAPVINFAIIKAVAA